MRKIALALLICFTSIAHAQIPSGARLSLAPGVDVHRTSIISSTLHLGTFNQPFLSTSLAGLPDGIRDVFVASGTAMCSMPMPLGAGGYQLIPVASPIGGMTANGGNAAAFDGILSKGYASSAKSGTVGVAGYDINNAVGAAFPTPHAVTKVTANAPVDDGFQGDEAIGSWELVASNTSSLASALPIATGQYGAGDGPLASFTRRFQNTTSYLYYWFVINGNGAQASYIAQLLFYEDVPNPPRGIVGSGASAQSDHDIPNCVTDSGIIDCPLGSCQHVGAVQVVAGQASCTLDYGLDRHCGIWNANNQKDICLKGGDPRPPVRASGCHPGIPCYVYSPAVMDSSHVPYAVGPTEGNPMIRIRVLSGQPDQSINVRYRQGYSQNAKDFGPTAYWFGVDNYGTDQSIGSWWNANFDNAGFTVTVPGAAAPVAGQSGEAELIESPFLGEKVFTAVEGQRAGTAAFFGEISQRISACYKN